MTTLIQRHRAQLFQQANPVLDIALIRCLDEGKGGDIPQSQRRHLQDHRGQIGTQDLRIGKGGTRQEILLIIQTDADTVGDTSTPPLTLIGGGLRDRLNRQALYLRSIAITANSCSTGIDNVFNSWHRQRGLCHVSRQHDAPSAMGVKHTVLFGGGEAGI